MVRGKGGVGSLGLMGRLGQTHHAVQKLRSSPPCVRNRLLRSVAIDESEGIWCGVKNPLRAHAAPLDLGDDGTFHGAARELMSEVSVGISC